MGLPSKELNWNADTDIDWSQPMPDRGDTPQPIFWDDYKPYQELSNEDKFKTEFAKRQNNTI